MKILIVSCSAGQNWGKEGILFHKCLMACNFRNIANDGFFFLIIFSAFVLIYIKLLRSGISNSNLPLKSQTEQQPNLLLMLLLLREWKMMNDYPFLGRCGTELLQNCFHYILLNRELRKLLRCWLILFPNLFGYISQNNKSLSWPTPKIRQKK